VAGDVGGEQLDRAEAARIREPGQRGRERDAGAIPTEESRAELTTVGRPHSSRDLQRPADAAEAGHLDDDDVGGTSRATRTGSSALRIDSSAATRTSIPLRANRTRSSLRSSTDGQGCSAYSRS
jgi:hypothetical protein